MPRQIKNYKNVSHTTNAWEFYQDRKLFVGIYGVNQTKVISRKPYWDIYVKIGAKPKENIEHFLDHLRISRKTH